MSLMSKIVTVLLTMTLFTQFNAPRLEAITYVTDTGGYAYDQSRASTNLAPAIALSTVAIVAVIAIAVQNSHGSSSHSSDYGSHRCSSSHGHAGYSSGSYSSSSSSYSSYSSSY